MAAKGEYLKVTVTQLEMEHAPSRPPRHPPILPQPITLLRVYEPTAAFYRYLPERHDPRVSRLVEDPLVVRRNLRTKS